MQLVYETEYVRNMFDHMTADDLIELIILKWIRKGTKIVNHVCMRSRVCINANCAGKFVLTATNVENLCHALI